MSGGLRQREFPFNVRRSYFAYRLRSCLTDVDAGYLFFN